MADKSLPNITYAQKIYVDESGIEHREVVHIDEVNKDEDCKYICYGCKKQLIAKKGDSRAHHFAHANNQTCAHAYESMLHLVAKRILSEEKQICLPERKVNFPRTANSREVVKPDTKFLYDNVEEEKRLCEKGTSIIPDIVLIKDNKKLLIEVYVTHKIDERKREKIKELCLSAIEVDLSKIDRSKDIDYEWLRKILVGETSLKIWINNDLENRILNYYQSEDIAQILKIGEKHDCIYKQWYGKQGAQGKKFCSHCVYCAGIIDGYVYCHGNSDRKELIDVTGKQKPASYEVAMEFLCQEDEVDLCNCRCPKCGNNLRVTRNLGLFNIECIQPKEQCDFSAKLNIPENMIHYISRKGEHKRVAISKKIQNRMPAHDEMTMYERKHLVGFSKGYCPYCNSKLKINPKEPHTIICRKYDECYFQAKVGENGKAYFNKRYGDREKVVMDLPLVFRYKG